MLRRGDVGNRLGNDDDVRSITCDYKFDYGFLMLWSYNHYSFLLQTIPGWNNLSFEDLVNCDLDFLKIASPIIN